MSATIYGHLLKTPASRPLTRDIAMVPMLAIGGRTPALSEPHAARLASHGLASTSYAVSRASRHIATQATLARSGHASCCDNSPSGGTVV